MTSTLADKAVVGRRVEFTFYRDLDTPDGHAYPGIITGTEPGLSGALLARIRLDGKRSTLTIPVAYEGLTYLDQVVPVPDLPMGRFTPAADDMNGFYEHSGVLVLAIGEDGEDLVVITDDKEKAFTAAIGYGPELGFDPDYFDREDMQARWVVFEWQPEDAECAWFMNPAAEGDDQAVHVYYLPTA